MLSKKPPFVRRSVGAMGSGDGDLTVPVRATVLSAATFLVYLSCPITMKVAGASAVVELTEANAVLVAARCPLTARLTFAEAAARLQEREVEESRAHRQEAERQHALNRKKDENNSIPLSQIIPGYERARTKSTLLSARCPIEPTMSSREDPI